MIRYIAERIARGHWFRRHIQVAGRKAPIFVTPDAQLKYLKFGSRSFDDDLIDLAERRISPTDVVWDIGANVGTFTVAAATVADAGRVIAVEADIWLAGLLRRTAAESFFGGRIEVVPCAVAARPGVARFMIAARGRASNALELSGGRSQMGGAREVVLVPTLSLDDLLAGLPAPNFVKIDVEGAELMVLEGAARLIGEIRPVFYVEVDETSATRVYELFNSSGYIARDPTNGSRLSFCLENTLFEPL